MSFPTERPVRPPRAISRLGVSQLSAPHTATLSKRQSINKLDPSFLNEIQNIYTNSLPSSLTNSRSDFDIHRKISIPAVQSSPDIPTGDPSEVTLRPPRPPRRATTGGVDESVNEIRIKLTIEERLLEEDRTLVQHYNSSLGITLAELKSRIEERLILISALKQSANLQNDQFITSGYMKMRRSRSEIYVRYFFLVKNRQLLFFKSESDVDPLGSISLSSVSRIVFRKKKPNSFSLHSGTITRFEFETDTPEECTEWIKTIAADTSASVSDAFVKTQTKNRRFTRVIRGQFEKNPQGSLTKSVGFSVKRRDIFYPTKCSSAELNSFKSSLSPDFEAIEADGHAQLKSGTLADLVSWAIIHSTIPNQKNLDASALFLCLGWVCKPSEFATLVERLWNNWCNNQFPMRLTLDVMMVRFHNFVSHWIESPVVSKDYTEECSARVVLKTFALKVQNGDSHLHNAKLPREFVVDKSVDHNSVTADIIKEDVLSFSKDAIINQLCIDEAELFQQINLREFMDMNWEKEEDGPGVFKLVTRYNKISRWAAFTILDAPEKDQVKVFCKFVSISHKLHVLQNYSTCTAILGGLADASIARLKRISDNTPEKYSAKLAKLKEIYSPVNGYKLYRQLPIRPCCLPALAVYLRDLTLSLDGNNVYASEEKKVINFERMKLVTDRVLEIQQATSDLSYFKLLEGDPVLRRHLSMIDPPSSDDLYEKSLTVEPPRSKKTLEEEIAQIRSENDRLKAEIDMYKEEAKKRVQTQQQILEQIQNSNSKASATVRALLTNINDGTTTDAEQIILLKLQLQAALDLYMSKSGTDKKVK